MCNMLMSLKDESTLRQIEKDCKAVSDAMLSFPFMIPGTRYYKGIKVQSEALRYRHVQNNLTRFFVFYTSFNFRNIYIN